MSYLQVRDNEKLIDNLCVLVKARNFVQAEKILLEVVDETSSHANGMATLNSKKLFIREIYSSFNKIYRVWLKKNKFNIDRECKQLFHLKHPNFLISHVSNYAEMDDLLYGLITFNNTSTQKMELKSNLRYYFAKKAY